MRHPTIEVTMSSPAEPDQTWKVNLPNRIECYMFRGSDPAFTGNRVSLLRRPTFFPALTETVHAGF